MPNNWRINEVMGQLEDEFEAKLVLAMDVLEAQNSRGYRKLKGGL